MLKTKKRKLASTVLAIAVAAALILPASVWAATAGHFETFLTNATAANATLNAKAPRDITVEGPQKYIESIEVIHKKAGNLIENGTSFVAITNIDVVTKDDASAQSIRIKVLDGTGAEIANKYVTPYKIENDAKYFQFGLANLPNSYDLTIEVHWNSTPSGTSLRESKIFAVPEGSSDIFKISESFTYKTAGENYSFYDLLADPGLFTELLVEHKLAEIKMNNLKTN